MFYVFSVHDAETTTETDRRTDGKVFDISSKRWTVYLKISKQVFVMEDSDNSRSHSLHSTHLTLYSKQLLLDKQSGHKKKTYYWIAAGSRRGRRGHVPCNVDAGKGRRRRVGGEGSLSIAAPPNG